MRRALLGLLATSSLVVGSALVATPAEAAPRPVTISKVSTRYVGWKGTAVVKPVLKKAKKVKILKRSFTVQQGSKVVRRTTAAANLRVGTYRLTSKVTYTYRGKRRTVVAKQGLTVKQGRCATAADLRLLKKDAQISPDVVGDSVATVSSKLRSRGTGLTYTTEEMIVVLGFFKKVAAAEEPGLGSIFDVAIAEVKVLQDKGVTTIEDRSYAGCGDDFDIYATFANGELYAAEDDSDIFAGLGAPATVSALGR